MDARQMSRKRAAIGAASGGARLGCRLVPLVVGGFARRDGLLDILKRQAELVRIELLGTAAKLHALQLAQKTPKAIVSRQRSSRAAMAASRSAIASASRACSSAISVGG